MFYPQLYVLEISYCLWITMTKNPATREMIVYGVGLRFVSVTLLDDRRTKLLTRALTMCTIQCLANVFQALWSIFFMLRLFLVSEIFLLLSALLMLTVWMTLLKYPASLRNPFTWLFVHLPMRMYLLFLINLAIWQNGLIALK